MEYEWPQHFQPEAVRSGFGGGTLSSHAVALEAWRRGLEVSFLPPDGRRLTISDGERTVGFNHSRTDFITDEAYEIVESKYRTSETLRNAGVPTPESYLFDTRETGFEELRAKAEELKFPVVLKPVRGSVGRGVFANIPDAAELERYYRHLIDDLKVRRIVLERHHFGDDYRLYVVGETFSAACKRIPANVVGDGRSTVNQLINAKNAVRRQNPFLASGLIVKDYEVMGSLERAGYRLNSVPADGEYVALREKANASAGGDVVDVTDQVPQRFRDAAVRAVNAVPGLPAAGVDMLWDPENRAGRESDFVIIEMNSRAHIGLNMYPTHGTGQDVPRDVLDYAFPASLRRADAEQLVNLSFDRAQVLAPIFDGVASRVSLTPMPEHGFPFRRHYSLPQGLKLKPKDRKALRIAASRLGIWGELDLEAEAPRLVMLAESVAAAQKMYHRVSAAVGAKPKRLGNYDEVAHAGFIIH